MGGCCSRDVVCKEGLGNQAEEEVDDEFLCGEVGVESGVRVRFDGSCGFASMYTQQGLKGVNQDAMVLWEDFGGEKDSIFCGVFDGHGQFGHKVAAHVRDNLPSKLSSHLKSLASARDHQVDGDRSSSGDTLVEYHEDNRDNNDRWLSSWKNHFIDVFEELDDELSMNTSIDCVCSGTTAVSVVKHMDHLLVSNLGDSRAILGTRDEMNKLVPVQLTVDLKPNLPGEVERISSCKGRVFALKEEPDVHRLWLPDDDCPGLAMARAFGDFCLKDYGLISTPQLSSWKVTDKDEFVVLATDGVNPSAIFITQYKISCLFGNQICLNYPFYENVELTLQLPLQLWDVLSNKQVVKAVSSARNRADAAKLLVHRAVRTWRTRYPTSKVDDCAVICLFLKHPCFSTQPSFEGSQQQAKSRELSFSESFETAKSSEVSDANKEWTALEGISRVNSLVKMPRFARIFSWRQQSKNTEEEYSKEGKKNAEN